MKIIPDKLKILAGFKARQAKFQSLMSKRQQNLPNECYEDRFIAVADSEEGKQLFAQMHRPETDEANLTNQSSVEVAGFRTKEEAQQAFLAHVEALTSKGITRDDAWRTAAWTEPGKSAYYAWKVLSSAERPEIVRTPPPQPSDLAVQKTRDAISRHNEK